MTTEYYRQLNINSNITSNLKKKIEETSEDKWITKYEQNLILLTIDDFALDPKIVQLIKDIGNINRLAIYRFFGKECYNWHTDAIRTTALNLLISGFDSMCLFGQPAAKRRFVNISSLQHKPDQYYLMNVHHFHSVYNFGKEIRYVLSLGLPDITYTDACEYLQQNDLLTI
jgi:hypothetical protein